MSFKIAVNKLTKTIVVEISLPFDPLKNFSNGLVENLIGFLFELTLFGKNPPNFNLDSRRYFSSLEFFLNLIKFKFLTSSSVISRLNLSLKANKASSVNFFC